ncbi:MAG: hypothetical protein JXR37_36200 [Kiritimatiellae bacterium]|nr:hypothetical protein [Kiritimatiellia bacterium]
MADEYIYELAVLGAAEPAGAAPMFISTMNMTPGSIHMANYTFSAAHGFQLGVDTKFTFQQLRVPTDMIFKASYTYTSAEGGGATYRYGYVDWDGPQGADSAGIDATDEVHQSMIYIWQAKADYEARRYMKNEDGGRGELLDREPVTLWTILGERQWAF